MKRKKPGTIRRKPRGAPSRAEKTFGVTPEEKAELLSAVAEADRGGSLPFEESMAEVRRMSDQIADVLDRGGVPLTPPK